MSDYSMAMEIIAANEDVKKLLAILLEAGKKENADELATMLVCVASMESELAQAVDELKQMRRELHNMREERNHPVRTALQSAAQSLETNINETRSRLNELKEKIVEGCKNAIAAVNRTGISALNNVARFFKIKPLLESVQRSLQKNIETDRAAIAKIEAVSTQYHSAGLALRNIGRLIIGKEPVSAVKPNGKLAKFLEAPFEREEKRLTRALKDVDGAINALDRLEKCAAAEREAEKASVLTAIRNFKSEQSAKKETPEKNRSKQAETAL